ncbi:MAG: DUF6128 domain-containing protein [Lachnospiraceae bacterium]|nr:DUF6128 domain-containing protein [Lachnospiraceae bacterium]
MGDYKRLISYIYSYERGTKSKNAGFAKIESRNGICKVNISLRIADELMNEAEDNMLEVFFFYRDNGEVRKVFLERIRIVNGCSMIKMRMNSDNIGNVGISIDRITGIFICTRAFLKGAHNLNIVYASEWDDIPIEVNEFKEKNNTDINIQNNAEADLKIAEGPLDGDTYDIKGEALENLVLDEYFRDRINYDGNHIANTEETDIKSFRNSNQVSESNIDSNQNVAGKINAESQLESVLSGNSGTEIENEVKSEIKSEMEVNAGPEPKLENDTKSEIEVNAENITKDNNTESKIEPETDFADDRKKCNNKLADMLKEEQKNDEIDDTGNADSVAGDYFRMLCNCYPKIRVNEINGECIKITPHDISYLPKKYWHLCNNSFLLHGFYNYKYLLLCEKKMDSGKKYLVGVPGMFHQKEQVIARMFGFTEFECNNATNRYGNKAMKFGYWCMYL